MPASPTLSSQDWPSYIRAPAPASDRSYQEAVRGPCPSASFPGSWGAHLMSFPSWEPPPSHPRPGSEACHHILPAVCRTWWGVAPGSCFRHVSSPYTLNHWCLCCWLQALSSVSKLGKYRPCRPAWCSPTTVCKLNWWCFIGTSSLFLKLKYERGSKFWGLRNHNC